MIHNDIVWFLGSADHAIVESTEAHMHRPIISFQAAFAKDVVPLNM